MNFSEFAKILKEFYKGEMNKGDFVKALFCNIADNEIEIDRSNITFAKYMEGNSIKPIVVEIKYNLDTEKFKKYLAQREHNTNAKKKLCNAFKDCAPDINIDNVFDKITSIFVDIINDAYNEVDGRCKTASNMEVLIYQ